MRLLRDSVGKELLHGKGQTCSFQVEAAKKKDSREIHNKEEGRVEGGGEKIPGGCKKNNLSFGGELQRNLKGDPRTYRSQREGEGNHRGTIAF